jgi:hypothetical protein
MIKKTILFSAILFLLYSFFIATLGTNVRATLNVQQEYFGKSQQLLYEEDITGKDVIVGSSVTHDAILETNINDFYNIGLTSLGVFEGLNLVSIKKQLPKCIYIETNYIQREEKKKYMSFLNSPEQYYPKKIFASLREDRQPVALIGPYCSKFLIVPFIKLFIPNKKKELESIVKLEKVHPDDQFSKMISNTKNDYKNTPDAKLLAQKLQKLDSIVMDYTSKGVQIVFVELPINHELVNSPRSIAIRDAFLQKFPADKFNYIQVPDSLQYKTIDGVHLTENEAELYTDFFKSKMLNR